MNKKIALIVALGVGFPYFGNAQTQNARNEDPAMRARMGEIKDKARFHELVDASADIYAAMTKGPHGSLPSSVAKNVRCIAVIPNVMTGALIVGGTHGVGLASCKDSTNTWTQPAAISLNQGSIGLQAGAKSTDVVLFFQSKDAEQALKRGEFAIGTDVSAVAGTFDNSLDTSTAGLVAYTRTEGLFAGASINGSKVGRDKEELENFYGKKVDYTALLEGRESPDSSGYTQKLTKLFPQS